MEKSVATKEKFVLPPPSDRVLNLRGKGHLKWGEDVLYIGRSCNRSPWNLLESFWHNPYKIGREMTTVEEVLAAFRDYIKGSKKHMDRLFELDGNDLACWCHPKPCHGHVLIQLRKEQLDEQRKRECNRGRIVGKETSKRKREDAVESEEESDKSKKGGFDFSKHTVQLKL